MMRPAGQEPDVPYGENWHDVDEADAWAEAADRTRPWRSQFRDAIAEQVSTLPGPARVLELGSGPGFLAERVLERCGGDVTYTLLDFSEPMLAMSQQRLVPFANARYVLADFKTDEWVRRIDAPFDCVVSMQAIHEVRHKRHVPRLYGQIHASMASPGLVLICDHVPLDDSEKSAKLYMTADEQLTALSSAGFEDVGVALSIDKLKLYRGRKSSLR